MDYIYIVAAILAIIPLALLARRCCKYTHNISLGYIVRCSCWRLTTSLRYYYWNHGPQCPCKGCYYGYPSCCVEWHYNALEVRRCIVSFLRKQGITDFTTYVPRLHSAEQKIVFKRIGIGLCQDHAVKVYNGMATIETLIQPYRRASHPFIYDKN